MESNGKGYAPIDTIAMRGAKRVAGVNCTLTIVFPGLTGNVVFVVFCAV